MKNKLESAKYRRIKILGTISHITSVLPGNLVAKYDVLIMFQKDLIGSVANVGNMQRTELLEHHLHCITLNKLSTSRVEGFVLVLTVPSTNDDDYDESTHFCLLLK